MSQPDAPVLDPWTERTCLSAYDSGGRRMSPARAYSGMPADAKLAAAICDAAISGQWGWASSVLLVVLGEAEPSTSSRTQKFFEERGWRDVEDVYEAAGMSNNQRIAYNLRLSNFMFREIGELMGTTAMMAQMQCIRSTEKLKRLMLVNEGEYNG